MKHAKLTLELELMRLNPMGELAPVAPEFPKKPYNRFLGNPPEGETAQQAYAEEMGIELDENRPKVNPLEPVLIHEVVHGHEPSKTQETQKSQMKDQGNVQ